VAKVTPNKSPSRFYALLLLVALSGAGVLWYVVQGAKPKPITLNAAAATLPKAEGYLRGNPDAPVTIIEFADFECPGCGRFAAVEEPDIRARLIDAGLANFRFFDFPLTQVHKNTLAASLAASCAADQGKFWELHDAIFAAQDQWNTQATENPRKVLDGLAQQVGLDMAAYATCFDSQKNLPRIQAHQQAGIERGVSSTPTLVIGDQMYAGGLRFDELRKLVDSLAAVSGKPVPGAAKTDAKADIKAPAAK
jgi:protein-disulfide isomerase